MFARKVGSDVGHIIVDDYLIMSSACCLKGRRSSWIPVQYPTCKKCLGVRNVGRDEHGSPETLVIPIQTTLADGHQTLWAAIAAAFTRSA